MQANAFPPVIPNMLSWSKARDKGLCPSSDCFQPSPISDRFERSPDIRESKGSVTKIVARTLLCAAAGASLAVPAALGAVAGFAGVAAATLLGGFVGRKIGLSKLTHGFDLRLQATTALGVGGAVAATAGCLLGIPGVLLAGTAGTVGMARYFFSR